MHVTHSLPLSLALFQDFVTIQFAIAYSMQKCFRLHFCILQAIEQLEAGMACRNEASSVSEERL